mmetsp:Transcript_20428/g.17759  ORF Transcript_20428/g.17759 Transcript_20428/m.17759 type:complete len:80 (+) Transcript_20428:143-382(+)|eukprot:CAMPEP_0114581548 /NCGR_PEP_ID=MMETSP0125-20121206/5644_1 /TAXON_ID=485358 ORGANISM="Aristerostoma sp., Strain ATCC 50986" /NCGR_SAMPLE_ID=MMETSP0125 /ASSEMBLY_ACC=CAM_ASM_000245 /LENGTH=79 /DNA_ID=CAMNT_0001773841 /DNA_START=2196 /DNA_END=2435 /DNA_ORIENTATION=+
MAAPNTLETIFNNLLPDSEYRDSSAWPSQNHQAHNNNNNAAEVIKSDYESQAEAQEPQPKAPPKKKDDNIEVKLDPEAS